MRVGRIYAFVNMKGGVGKTTNAVMFADTLAANDRSVLFIDLDAQASGSYAIAGYDTLQRISAEKTNIVGYLGKLAADPKRAVLADHIVEGASNLSECGGLDLIAAHPELRLIERGFFRNLYQTARWTTRIDTALRAARAPIVAAFREIAEEYDAVVIDCPPGISMFVEAALYASDALVCPTAPEPIATLGLETIIGQVYASDELIDEFARISRPVPKLGVLFSMANSDSRGRDAQRQRAEIERVEEMADAPEYAGLGVGVIDDQVDRAPELASAFATPEIPQRFDERYRGAAGAIARRVTGSIIDHYQAAHA